MTLRSTVAENAFFARDELERNYACVQAGDAEGRRENIEAMPGTMTRFGELAMLHAAEAFPEATGKLLRASTAGKNLVYIGAGTESTAFADTDMTYVLKVNRKSVHWSEAERQEMVRQTKRDHWLMKQYLGKFMVPETVEVDTHPLCPDKKAIVTQQLYYDFAETDIFVPYEPVINHDGVENLTDEYPGVEDDLKDFAAYGLDMYENTGMLVDSSGFRNVVMAEREDDMRLTCLDGTPVKQNNDSVAKRIVGQLTALYDSVA